MVQVDHPADREGGCDNPGKVGAAVRGPPIARLHQATLRPVPHESEAVGTRIEERSNVVSIDRLDAIRAVDEREDWNSSCTSSWRFPTWKQNSRCGVGLGSPHSTNRRFCFVHDQVDWVATHRSGLESPLRHH
jgi:hypothetical protein